MLKVFNVKIYDLEQSLKASGYAMLTEPTNESNPSKDLLRMQKLVRASKNGNVHCHDNALTGIRVSFDVVYPQYWSMEAQRYHWLDIVTSSSKMHRLTKMDLYKSCNGFVDLRVIDTLQDLIKAYNDDPSSYNWMRVISNCPMGLELFMRCSTNYKQLQTIYWQRKDHRNTDWKVFCQWIESLPYFNELIKGE